MPPTIVNSDSILRFVFPNNVNIQVLGGFF